MADYGITMGNSGGTINIRKSNLHVVVPFDDVEKTVTGVKFYSDGNLVGAIRPSAPDQAEFSLDYMITVDNEYAIADVGIPEDFAEEVSDKVDPIV